MSSVLQIRMAIAYPNRLMRPGECGEFLFERGLGGMVDPERCRDHAHLGRVAHRCCDHMPLARSDECPFQHAVEEVFPGRFSLPGKGRFIGEHVIGRDHPPVSGQGIAGFEQDQVADNDIAGRDRCRVPVPDHLDRNIVPVGVQHIEFPAAPVFVEERDAGCKEDRDDDPDGVKDAAALDHGDNGRDADRKEQDPDDRVVEFFQVLFPERFPDRRGHGVGAVFPAELFDLFGGQTICACDGFQFVK